MSADKYSSTFSHQMAAIVYVLFVYHSKALRTQYTEYVCLQTLFKRYTMQMDSVLPTNSSLVEILITIGDVKDIFGYSQRYPSRFTFKSLPLAVSKFLVGFQDPVTKIIYS